MNKMLIYRHFSFTYLFNVSEGRCMPFIYYVLSNKSNIWQANTQDLLGNYNNYTTGFNTGEWTTAKTYNQDNGRLMTIITGPVSNRIQDLQYNYDAIGNLISRADNKPANAQLGYQVDEYTYDELNRLSAFSYGNQNIVPVVKTINYDNGGLGNITTMPDVGNFTYDTQRLHAITQITNNPGNINTTQQVDYTSFNKVLKLEDGQSGTAAFKKLMFKYGPDYSRRKTSYFEGSSATSVDKYFALGCYEEEVNNASGIAVKDFYINAGDGLAAIYRITGTNPGVMYYIHKDNMGSFDKVTNESGAVVDRYSFDAWGNRRNYDNWALSDNSTHLFSRGYTGHEHLDKFGLINMNGRLYDSKLGRFLSPDPVLQDPSNTQNYNRYSYCLNNPFAYTDPSGYVYGGANSNYVPGGTMPYYNNPGLSNFNTGSFHSTYDNDWGNYSANADGYFGSNGPAGVFGSANSSIIMGQFQDCITDIQNGYNIAYREGSGGYYLWFGGGRDNTISGEHIDQVLLNYSQVSLVSQMVEAYGESLNKTKFIIEFTSLYVDANEFNWKMRMSNKAQWNAAYKAHQFLKSKGYNNKTSTIKNGIPKLLKTTGRSLGIASAVVGVSEVLINSQINYSNVLDGVVTGASFIPGVGWMIGGGYFALNLISEKFTGKSIGNHLDSYMGAPLYDWQY